MHNIMYYFVMLEAVVSTCSCLYSTSADMRVEANRFHTLRRLKTGQGGDYFPEESCHMFAAKGLHVNRGKLLITPAPC